MNVLFLSNCRFQLTPYRDSSTRYRCYHFAEALHNAGHSADVTNFEQFNIVDLARYDIVSVLNPIESRKLNNVIASCKRLGIHTIADFDDAIFDPNLVQENAAVICGFTDAARVSDAFRRHASAIAHFDEVTLATPALRELCLQQYPNTKAFVLPNALSAFWMEKNSLVKSQKQQHKRITYMPGARTHDRNFATIHSILGLFMENNPEFELMIIGALNIDESQLPMERVVRGVWSEYIDLPLALCESWITIAPLEETRVNAARAHTKFIEAAAFGIPCIGTANSDLSEHQVDGLFLCETQADWLRALDQLMDEEYYAHCEAQLINYAQTHCMAEHIAQPLIKRWSTIDNRENNEHTADISQAS